MGLKPLPFLFLSLFTTIGLSLSFYSPQARAQSDSTVDDGFEPFADYSEFVEASTEETDVNFFRYGRLLSFGISVGQKVLDGQQRKFIGDSPDFGLFVSFYTTINFAFQFGYQTSSHDVFYEIEETDSKFEGTTRYNIFFVHAKYALNTQNLTRSVARFNPYVIGGVGQAFRESRSLNDSRLSAKDGAASFNIGAGLEHLFNHNRNFVGLQVMYHHASFPNENDPIRVTNSQDVDIDTGLRFEGNLWSINLNMGFNF